MISKRSESQNGPYHGYNTCQYWLHLLIFNYYDWEIVDLITVYFTALTTGNSHCKSNSNQNRTSKNVKAVYQHEDIVEIASSDDQFSTLVLAVKTSSLVETLKSDGPFTVFATTNTAFAKIRAKTTKNLLSSAGKVQLNAVLTYHVVAGSFSAKEIIKRIKASGGEFSLTTVEGRVLKASINQDQVLTDENSRVEAVTA